MDPTRKHFQEKTQGNCQKIRVDEPDQKLLKTNVIYICKIMKEKEVEQITNKLIINKRTGSKVYLRDPHKPSSKSSFIRHIALYNALPLELKALSIPSLKRKMHKLRVQFKD